MPPPEALGREIKQRITSLYGRLEAKEEQGLFIIHKQIENETAQVWIN